ncbi:MAG: GGDEF domain-containing protein [Clostridiales bacterium]|nr:GGDEF domain-containing protein [Clostridiales bacterium]
MGSELNLYSIYVADAVGIAILLIILVTRGWRIPARKEESRILVWMVVVSIINCLVDILVTTCDGMTGSGYYYTLIFGNTYLYLYNLIIGIGIIHMIVKHIEQKTTGLHMIFFWLMCVIEAVLLITNFIKPVVFKIDDNNIYSRGSYYMLFVVIGFVLILYGYAYYIIAKIRNPALRYFPVIEFLMPILVGNIAQMLVYGISPLPVSFAIAFAGIVISLQNESLYLDKLTGVYNRYELDKLLKPRRFGKNGKIAAMMLDLNGFKAINDNYSHEEGDRALVAFAGILTEAVGSEGSVIRFAGDEFIIIMLRVKNFDLDKYKQRIFDKVDAYNETSGKPYKLCTAIGGKVFELGNGSTNDLVMQIDELMYEDKGKYYKTHERHR